MSEIYEVALDQARIAFGDVMERYVRVREVPPDDHGVGVVFAYLPAKGEHTEIDMFWLRKGNLAPAVIGLSCLTECADELVEGVVNGGWKASRAQA